VAAVERSGLTVWIAVARLWLVQEIEVAPESIWVFRVVWHLGPWPPAEEQLGLLSALGQ